MARSRRLVPEIAAGSMADIAFLLLTFFLMVSNIEDEKGILTILPPWDPDPPKVLLADKNTLSIKVNANGEVLVEKQESEIADLIPHITDFLDNPDTNKRPDPAKALISLQNDRGTSYEVYIEVYNEIKRAYREIRNKYAQKKFGQPFNMLSPVEQKKVKEAFPIRISEAEPTAHGEE